MKWLYDLQSSSGVIERVENREASEVVVDVEFWR